MSANQPNSSWRVAGLAGVLIALSATPVLAQAGSVAGVGSPLVPLSWLASALVALWLLGLLFKRSFPRSRWAAPIIFALIAAAAVFVPCGQSYYLLLGGSGSASLGAGFAAFFGSTVAAVACFFWLRSSASPGAHSQQTLATASGLAKPTAPPNTPAPDVFISYKRDERPDVAAIAQRLTALKLNVWFDAEIRSGTPFDAEIDRKVRAAKCVLVC